jgi:catechol 2,3-dioxygenase-like lactoylglutathione lyase family enzyme
MLLNLLVLRCTDMDRCRAFYECFGYRFEKHAHGTGPQHYAAEDAGNVLELYPATESTPADQVGLGFRVASFADVQAKLRAAGFAPGEMKENPWGPSFVVRDPQNRRVEVTQT